MKNKIVPAIIAKTQEELVTRIKKVKDHVRILQLDVMDGIFVPTHSLDFDFILPKTNCTYEAHLMVNDPINWIEKHSHAVDIILAHIESCKDPERVIELIRRKGKKPGFVINPQTSVQKIKPYIEKVDQILVMTVDPGFYGSKFLPETLQKVSKIRKLYPNLELEVDGGINKDTVSQAFKAGANLFVCGSYLQKSEDVKQAINGLMDLMR
jgi:ribulose-phosphate 3-epimerase